MARAFLVDGNNLVYRYNSVMDLEFNGHRTSAIFGICNILEQWRLSTRYSVHRIFFFWDSGHSKERKKLFPEYKKREPIVDEVERANYEDYLRQLNFLRTFVPALGCYSVFGDGYECDDLLALWCSLILDDEDGKESITIVSGDSDYEQLVSDKVAILTPKSDYLLPKNIVDKHGVPPEHIVYWKALLGDSSDKIPGIPGIGEKRAVQLIQDFPCITEMRPPSSKDVEASTSKVARYAMTLRKHWDEYERNVDLIRLPSDIVTIKRKEVTVLKPAPDMAAVKSAFMANGFTSLLTKFSHYWENINAED
jgi:DNA polymerase-1